MNTPRSHQALRWLLAPVLTLVLASTALATPTLEITPTRVEPGDIVLITYSGFMPGGYPASINVDGVAVQDIFILAGGSGTVFWAPPADLAVGGHDIDICATCFQGDLEERTNSVRVTMDSGDYTGSQFNIQPWAIEITQGVRGDIPTRTPPAADLVLPDEEIVHVANRRTVVRVYPWVEGGPDFRSQHGVRAQLWVSAGGVNYGPIEPERRGVSVYPSAVLEDLRSDSYRSWNFVLPPEVTALAAGAEQGTFSLTVGINPFGTGFAPECGSCRDDNIAYLYGNQVQHVGLTNDYAFTFRPHLVEADVEQEDESILHLPRPSESQLANTIRSLYQVMPIADGARGIRVMPSRDVDWSGTWEEEGWDQDVFLIANYLPGGEAAAAPPNDYYAFLYYNPGGCGGHSPVPSPFFRSGVCGGPLFIEAHELTHAIGSHHAGFGHNTAGGGGYDPDYPGNHGQVEPDSWGFDVYNQRIYPPVQSTGVDGETHCYMSYGSNMWVSRYTWNRVAGNLGSPLVGMGAAMAPPSLLAPAKRADILGFVAFRGLLDGAGILDLEPFVASYPPTQAPGNGIYELEFYDVGNTLLANHLPRLMSSQDNAVAGNMFAEAIALPVGWSEMRLRTNGTVTQTWQRSANPPTVAITSPASGFQWANTGNVTVTWNAGDADGDALTYRVFGQQTNANELFTLANGLTTPSFTLDLATLPAGGDWALIVEASDGLDRTYSAFATGYVAPMPPQVMIIQPPDNSVHVAGTKVPAAGMFSDLQGEVSPGNMVWSLDGNYVGSGTTFDVPDIPAGNHVLTLTVYNALQLEGTASVNLQVVDALAVPQLTAPADGATNVGLPADLSWTAVPGAISYRVQVAADPNFSEVVAEIGNLGEPTLPFQGGPAFGAYYWRVMAEHGAAATDWSLARSFTPNTASAVDDVPGAKGLALSVFPNPFNPATTVSFELPRDGHVNLAVYDLAGRLVRTLVDSEFATGRHEVDWNGRDKQGLHAGSGVYLMRLVTPGGETSLRATLLK